eukprot:4766707-Prymnesium_polylepis.1
MSASVNQRSSWYTLVDGRRHVVPYTHAFASHTKGRWVGRCVFDVMVDEMQCSAEYLREASSAGRLTVNGVPC